MTGKNSICIKCEKLVSYNSTATPADGEKGLIAFCLYGGKNAGNRKSCANFERASEEKISARLACFRGGEIIA